MPLDDLDAPLRMTWSVLGPEGRILAAEEAMTVAERLVEGGVFYLTIDGSPLACRHFAALQSILRRGGVRLRIVFSGSEGEWSGLADLSRDSELLLDGAAILSRVEEGDLTRLSTEVARLRAAGFEPTLSLVPDRLYLPLLPHFFDFCRSEGIAKFTLPNTPVDASFAALFEPPLPEQLDALRAQIAGRESPVEGVDVEIHDLFIWEILHPDGTSGGRAEYGGCQAANSLGHIDWQGTVHPCSSWPSPLGSLLTSRLDEIWATGLRRNVRLEVAAIPSGCSGCRDYSICYGGCRGLSRSLNRAGDGRDLLCRGRR